MGETDKTPAQVQQLIAQMGYQYRGNSYHLLQKNCNHFASDLCKELTGLEPPSWVGVTPAMSHLPATATATGSHVPLPAKCSPLGKP
jgi:hypothetical protein